MASVHCDVCDQPTPEGPRHVVQWHVRGTPNRRACTLAQFSLAGSVLTVVNKWSRQRPVLEVGFRMNGATMAAALDETIVAYGVPTPVMRDSGTENNSRVLDDWVEPVMCNSTACAPESPRTVATESINGMKRDERLSVTQWAVTCVPGRQSTHGAPTTTRLGLTASWGSCPPQEADEPRQGIAPAEAA